jgi:hypothetical protein
LSSISTALRYYFFVNRARKVVKKVKQCLISLIVASAGILGAMVILVDPGLLISGAKPREKVHATVPGGVD